MAESRIILVCGLVLVNIYSSSAQNGDSDIISQQSSNLAITDIYFNDVVISWNKTSFNNADSYKVEVNTTNNDGYCSRDVSSCTGDVCETSISDTACTNIAVPCYDVIMTVTGKDVDNATDSISTTFAPLILRADWNLNSTIDGNTLTVTWGPLTGDYVSCAKNVTITATCGDKEISKEKYNLDPTLESTSTVDLHLATLGCPGGYVTLITVTYMSGDVPTETKKTFVGELIYVAAPDPPTNISVLGNDAAPTKLRVTWEKPTTPIAAETVTGYTITYPVGMSVEVNDPAAVSHELTGLIACTNYMVLVAAKWSGGTGESGNGTGTTGSQAPGKPTNVTSNSAAKTEISVSWNPSVISSTCPLTGYTVNWTPKHGDEGGEHVGNKTTSYTITGLTHSTKYTITVTANTEDKKSEVSNQYTHTTAGEKGLSGGAIAGIVCGCLAGVALIGGVIFYCYKKEKLCFEK